MDLERREGESAYEHHKRIVEGKLVDKTLSDVDFSELCPIVYGQTYSSDFTRRMFYGSKRTIDLIEQEKMTKLSDALSTDPNGILSEIDRKLIELKKEQQKFFDQRREYTKIVSAEGRHEHLYERLVQAAGQLNCTVGNMYCTSTYENMVVGQSEAILVFSDWHYGMTTENIFNKYNTEICKSRVQSAVEETIRRIRLHKCRKLHIVTLGDLFHGSIHVSARVASEELACDQLMQVSEILAQAIEYLSGVVEHTNVYMTYGNHCRTVQSKNDSIHRDNMERIIPWWLKQRLSGRDNISVFNDFENEYLYFSVCGHGICAVHGDLDTVRGSTRLLPALIRKQYGNAADVEYVILGDKHHRESFEELGVTATICGSLCGSDDYANDKRLYSNPSQMLLIVDPDCGVDAEYRIKL